MRLSYREYVDDTISSANNNKIQLKHSEIMWPIERIIFIRDITRKSKSKKKKKV